MTPEKLEKATLREIAWDTDQQVELKEKQVTVQFNPESLKLAYSNQNASGDQRGGSAVQYVGSGSTKLSFDLWFDVSSAHHSRQAPPGDVRDLTQEVTYFITPKESKKKGKFIPPGVRFQWGTFLFDGVVESLSESLEYFSEDGIPLRGKVSVSLTRQEIKYEGGQQTAGNLGSFRSGSPRQPVTEGQTAQSIAEQAGKGEDWPQVAAANGIENPRAPAPGSFLDTGAAGGGTGGLSTEGGLAAGASFGATASAGAALGGGLRAGVAAGALGTAGTSLVGALSPGASTGLGAAIGGGNGGGAGAGISQGAAASAAARAAASFDSRRRRS